MHYHHYKNDESFLRSINAKKNEISDIASVTIKIADMLADGAGRWGGPQKEHLDKIRKYEMQIHEYISDNLHREIQKDIDEVNELISNRNKQKDIDK